MLAQVRIYTINRGEMDAFLKHFQQETMPLHDQAGIPIVTTWVNKPQNEFIWIRTFADKTDLEAKQRAFQEAARAAGVVLGGHVAKMEIREVEPAFASAVAPA
jgi:NIPSNAP